MTEVQTRGRRRKGRQRGPGRGRLALRAVFVAAAAAPVMAVAADGGPAVRDPFEPVNRALFKFNTAVVDRFLVRPVVRVYRAVTPAPVRRGLGNATSNLREPATVVNAILQARPAVAAKATGRFLVNSTVGLGGLIDVAGRQGLDREPADFGQTLGRWGVGQGPYLYLPVVGPTTVRDGVGGLVGYAADPVSQATGGTDTDFAVGRSVVRGLEARSEADALIDSVMTDSTDPYATIRGAYAQSRAATVAAARGEDEDLPDFGDLPPEETD